MISLLYRFYFIIIAISFLVATLSASKTIEIFHREQVLQELVVRGRLIENEIGALLEKDVANIDAVSKELARKSECRITVMLPSGQVVGDSEENPSTMDNLRDRLEVAAALSGKIGDNIRYSAALKTDILYAALPIVKSEKIIGVLRLATDLNAADKALKTIYIEFALAGIAMAIFAGLGTFAISQRLSRPLKDLKDGALHFAAGDLKFRLPLPDSEEIADLANALNDMVAKFDETKQSLVKQRNFLDAILSSMIEAVIAVDKDQNITSVNRAAAELFEIAPTEQTRSIQETIRNVDIQKLIRKTLSTTEPTEEEIKIVGATDTLLHAHGAVLHNIDGKNIGAVIVVNNITRLKRLETVRRDFVANVSHELKTPITAIKGFVETLQDGAINNREEAERFIGVILRQADRLNAIVEDLLSLSRIEQEAEKNEIVLQKSAIKDVLDAAIQSRAIIAGEKNLNIELNCDGEIQAMINAELLEQSVGNLLDNAIKYSDPGKTITVSATESLSEVTISVADRGCGIEREHHPRLFERFYRVDKARSRKLGGTGLGLAIVKHITIAHGGRVGVESKIGEGSIFSIYLPKIQIVNKK